MWSEMTIKAGNQLYQKHSPHNPALHITNARLPIGYRNEASLDCCCCNRSDPTCDMVFKDFDALISRTEAADQFCKANLVLSLLCPGRHCVRRFFQIAP